MGSFLFLFAPKKTSGGFAAKKLTTEYAGAYFWRSEEDFP